MNTKCFLIPAIILTFVNNLYSQYKPFTQEFSDSCTVITEKKISDNRKIFMCKHVCKGDSYTVELEDINDKGDFYRSGLSVWYYDNNFTKVRKRSTFWRGLEYGMVQEFYENGLIKMDGICKTIRYFPKYTGNKSVMCKVDLMDTTVFTETRFTRDSIHALEKYCYFDSILYKSKKATSKTKGVSYPTLAQKFGEWKYYDDAGKLIRREFYTKGILTRTINY